MLNTTHFLNHLFTKNKKDTLKLKQMSSGGSCIALWDVVDYRYVSLHLGG
ncbi:hypothetical protein AKN40_1733 [Escherichia coli]|nr:hypothetical protein AKN40_1733 [Escherichia coli]